jgi:AcrR family transcriptional regulator
MVQKSARPRGRPRAYDPGTALWQALQAFWSGGYAATSLDELAAATGMNRPSLYGAFGDKKALYLKALDHYRASGRAALAEALAGKRPLREELRRVYDKALAIYFSGEGAPRGCFLIGTATSEAVENPDVRAALGGALREFDKAFEARLRLAREQGELSLEADPVALARLASAILHTLALRSRAGDPKPTLEETAAAGVDLICRA